MIDDQLSRVKEVFLADDVDDETREENRSTIEEWEKTIRANTALQQWQQHDITKEIALKAREVYVESARLIVSKRDLTDQQRTVLWAKRDAAHWILSITSTDPQQEIQRVEEEVRRALAET